MLELTVIAMETKKVWRGEFFFWKTNLNPDLIRTVSDLTEWYLRLRYYECSNFGIYVYQCYLKKQVLIQMSSFDHIEAST